jgi:L-lactate dehydrogenase complex protein LldF
MTHRPEGTLRQTVESKLANPTLQGVLRKALATVQTKSADVLSELTDVERLRETAASIRQESVYRLRENLQLFEKNCAAGGTKVLWAATAADATRQIVEIAQAVGALRVIMSKTMVGEEVELERSLKGAGKVVIQSDLGERVVQLAGEPPSHITAPCLHMSAAEVGRLLADKSGMDYTDDPQQICRFLARNLRSVFLQADMGITGANLLIAESGSVLIVENEGNVRMGYTLPPVHVVVTGIEKVVGTLAEASCLLALLPRLATGQRSPCYASLLPPAPLPGQKRYLVLVDNGRTALFNGGPFRELLRCIRCGACMNVCPVFEKVGGHAYLWTYPGSLGIALGPFMAPPAVAAQLPDLCSLCGECATVCPVKIPLDRLVVHARARAWAFKDVVQRRAERRRLRLAARALESPFFFRTSHWGHRMLARFLPATLAAREGELGWSGEREGPQPARQLFRSWWAAHARERRARR